MENTFFQPRAVKREMDKRAAEKKAAEKSAAQSKGVDRDEATARGVEQSHVGTLVPAADATQTADATPVARLRTLDFQPREMIALSQLALHPDADTASQSFRLRVEETPAEFVHLYAGLERLVGRVSDLSSVTGNLMETEHPYMLGVTSALVGEGKTTTALHLAMTIARSTAKRVCLVDLSLGADGPAARLGMPAGEGLVAAVEDENDTVPCFTVSGCDGLMVVPGGRTPANAARFARSPRVAQFLVATRHAFDVVLVDMPAISTENVLPLLRMTDGVVMVVRAGVTPREVVVEALETVGNDRVNCVILNRAKSAAPRWLQKRFARV